MATKEEKDIFAPPSKEELDMLMAPPSAEELAFSEPTEKELASISEEPETSTGEALLQGAGEGITFGFGDEITSVPAAAIGMMTTPDLPGESRFDKYARLMQLYKDVAREKQQKAMEDRPGMYTAGAIGGGLLTGGIGATKAGVTGIKSGIKMGTAGGAVTGAGMSDTEDLGQMAKEAAVGAGLGAVGGVALPGLAKLGSGIKSGAKAIGRKLSETDTGKIFKAYQAGEDLLGDIASNFKKMKDLGGKVTAGLQEQSNKINKQIKTDLEALEQSGYKKELGPILKKRREEFAELAKDENEEIAKSAKNILKTIDNYLEGPVTTKLQPKVSDAQKTLNQEVKKRKAYQDLLAKKRELEAQDPVLAAQDDLLGQSTKAQALTGDAPMDFPKTFTGVEGKQALVQDLLSEADGNTFVKKIASLVEDRQIGDIEIITDDLGNEIFQFSDGIKTYQKMIPTDLKNELITELKPVKMRMGSRFGENVEMTPSQLRQAEQAFKPTTGFGEKEVPSVVRKASQGLVDDIRELDSPLIQGQRKELGKVLDKYKSMTGKEMQEQLSGSEQEIIREKMATLLAKADTESLQKGKLPDILEGFTDIKDPSKQISGLKEIAPELADMIEKEAPELAEKIRLGVSLDPKIIKTIIADPTAQAMAQFGGPAGLLGKGAQIAGKTSRAMRKGVENIGKEITESSPVKAVSEMSKNFIEKDPAKLATLAQKMATGGKTAAEASRIISKALTKDGKGQRALLFGLMQNPEYRKLIEEYSQDE
jgi:hypothetical protein